VLEAIVEPAEWLRRVPAVADLAGNEQGCGRELFAAARAHVSGAEAGAMIFGDITLLAPAAPVKATTENADAE
jgi:phosphogluconate dehydratase